MIETDCPKLKIDRADKAQTTPWSTYYLAKWLAGLRDLSLGEVLKAVCDNLCELYGLTEPGHQAL